MHFIYEYASPPGGITLAGDGQSAHAAAVQYE